ASSALPGTATNEDCELDPTNPTKDFSVGAASPASQTVVVSDGGGGIYQTTLYSYDWGGKVTITVTGTTPTGVAATGTLALPVDNVSGSFTASTELPRMSFVNPTQPTLDMATVIYDGTACKGSEPCDTTSKFGVRQWGNSTLGYTPVFGTATTYGTTTVYKRA